MSSDLRDWQRESEERISRRVDRLTGLLFTFAALAAVIASLVVIGGSGSAMDKLKLATGYATLIFLFFLSMIVLLYIAWNKINLSQMLDELSGGASLSRFQLLVFTFVIAFSFFVIVATQGKLPDIPANVLALLGVSASTYAVSKGLQISSSDMPAERETTRGNAGSSSGAETQSDGKQSDTKSEPWQPGETNREV